MGDATLRHMKFHFALCAVGLVACGGGSQVCPTGWDESATSPGDCAPSASFVSQTTATIGSGVYGFMRDDAHGGRKTIGGATVFAIPSTQPTCDAASLNATATTTTDQDGVFVLKLAAGDYRITSGEVPSCTLVHIDANSVIDVSLTSP